MPGQPASAERRRGPISLAGLIPAPVFRPKLKTANRSKPKLEIANERRLGLIYRLQGLYQPRGIQAKTETQPIEPKLEITNERRRGPISLAGLIPAPVFRPKLKQPIGVSQN